MKITKTKLKEIIREEIQKLNETGEMSKADIKPGGEHFKWAKSIADDVKKLSRLTKGKVKFKRMNPFDKYQGPYASVIINGALDSIWDAGIEGRRILFIEKLRLAGNYKLLAMAINGDEKAHKEAQNFVKKIS